MRKQLAQHLVQECLLPRARLSPVDAAFSARFIRTLHNISAGNLASLHLYDRVSAQTTLQLSRSFRSIFLT